MAAIRNLIVVVLALAGALAWGPPTMLAVCLGRGTCVMTAPKHAETAPCCRAGADEAPGSQAPKVSADACDLGCCGCCTTVRVGTGLDGGRPLVETPVPPSFLAATRCIAAPAPADAVVAFAETAVPRAPPERLLPLRI